MFDKLAVYFSSTVGMVLAGVCVATSLTLVAAKLSYNKLEKEFTQYKKDSELELSSLRTTKTSMQGSIDRLLATIALRNKEIEESKARGDLLAAQIGRIVNQAEKDRKQREAYIASILSYKPTPGADACKEADAQVVELIKERRLP